MSSISAHAPARRSLDRDAVAGARTPRDPPAREAKWVADDIEHLRDSPHSFVAKVERVIREGSLDRLDLGDQPFADQESAATGRGLSFSGHRSHRRLSPTWSPASERSSVR